MFVCLFLFDSCAVGAQPCQSVSAWNSVPKCVAWYCRIYGADNGKFCWRRRTTTSFEFYSFICKKYPSSFKDQYGSLQSQWAVGAYWGDKVVWLVVSRIRVLTTSQSICRSVGLVVWLSGPLRCGVGMMSDKRLSPSGEATTCTSVQKI